MSLCIISAKRQFVVIPATPVSFNAMYDFHSILFQYVRQDT